MKKSELRQIVKEVLKLEAYQQKEYAMSTNKDFKDGILSCVKQAMDNFFMKYYYLKDAIKIIKSIQPLINTFVSEVLAKLNKK